MLSNLTAVVLIMAALAAVSCYMTPEAAPSCRQQGTHDFGWGEVVYCPACDQ
jgi:hypothetical protein